jgi:rubrerythrin
MQEIFKAIADRQAAWDRALREGLPVDRELLYHGYAWPYAKGKVAKANLDAVDKAQLQIAGEDLDAPIWFTTTQFSEDRDGDIVVPKGVLTHSFQPNPVIFMGHQEWILPIAKGVDKNGKLMWITEENRCRGGALFDRHDEQAMVVRRKVLDGFLSACSIAFVPVKAFKRSGEEHHKAQPRNEGEGRPLGWVFEEVELTEWSIVGVPANAGALRDSLDHEKGMMPPRLWKALNSYAAKSTNEQGGCFTGWCPCPPCEEKTVAKTVQKVGGPPNFLDKPKQPGYGKFIVSDRFLTYSVERGPLANGQYAVSSGGMRPSVDGVLYDTLREANAAADRLRPKKAVFSQTKDSGDWTKLPKNKAEWLMRLDEILRKTKGKDHTAFPCDAESLYREGMDPKQAAFACARSSGPPRPGKSLSKRGNTAQSVTIESSRLGTFTDAASYRGIRVGRRGKRGNLEEIDVVGPREAVDGLLSLYGLKSMKKGCVKCGGKCPKCKQKAGQVVKGEMDDCVSRKIPIFMREHPDWDQKHAIAAAYGWCGEKVMKGYRQVSKGLTILNGDKDRIGSIVVVRSDKDPSKPYCVGRVDSVNPSKITILERFQAQGAAYSAARGKKSLNSASGTAGGYTVGEQKAGNMGLAFNVPTSQLPMFRRAAGTMGVKVTNESSGGAGKTEVTVAGKPDWVESLAQQFATKSARGRALVKYMNRKHKTRVRRKGEKFVGGVDAGDPDDIGEMEADDLENAEVADEEQESDQTYEELDLDDEAEMVKGEGPPMAHFHANMAAHHQAALDYGEQVKAELERSKAEMEPEHHDVIDGHIKAVDEAIEPMAAMKAAHEDAFAERYPDLDMKDLVAGNDQQTGETPGLEGEDGYTEMEEPEDEEVEMDLDEDSDAGLHGEEEMDLDDKERDIDNESPAEDVAGEEILDRYRQQPKGRRRGMRKAVSNPKVGMKVVSQNGATYQLTRQSGPNWIGKVVAVPPGSMAAEDGVEVGNFHNVDLSKATAKSFRRQVRKGQHCMADTHEVLMGLAEQETDPVKRAALQHHAQLAKDVADGAITGSEAAGSAGQSVKVADNDEFLADLTQEDEMRKGDTVEELDPANVYADLDEEDQLRKGDIDAEGEERHPAKIVPAAHEEDLEEEAELVKRKKTVQKGKPGPCPECGYHLNDGDVDSRGNAECPNCGNKFVMKSLKKTNGTLPPRLERSANKLFDALDRLSAN